MTAKWLNTETPATVAEARDRMVQEQLRARGIHEERVLSAMSKVPVREEFADAQTPTEALWRLSTTDRRRTNCVAALHRGHSMIEALEVGPQDQVLEIGTGTGYQAAILGELADELWTVERVPELATEGTADRGAIGIPQHSRSRGRWITRFCLNTLPFPGFWWQPRRLLLPEP